MVRPKPKKHARPDPCTIKRITKPKSVRIEEIIGSKIVQIESARDDALLTDDDPDGALVVQEVAFTPEQREVLARALKEHKLEHRRRFIRDLETRSIAYVPWREPASTPTPHERRAGLLQVKELATQLASAIDPGNGGIIGADWVAANDRMRKAIPALDQLPIPGMSGPLDIVHGLLDALAVCTARLAARPPAAHRQRSKPEELASEIALMWLEHFGTLPSGTCPDDDRLFQRSSPYMKVVAICFEAWSKMNATPGILRRPAHAAVKRLRAHVKAH